MLAAGGGPGGRCRPGYRRPRTTGYSVGLPGAFEIQVLNEAVEQGRVPVLRNGGLAVYVHVDDIVVMGDGRKGERVDKLLLAIVAELRALGFKVTDIRLCGQVVAVVGFRPVLSPARLELPARKLALLHETFNWLLGQEEVV